MADELGISEGALIRALPAEWVTVWPGEQAQALLAALPEWGPVTTIVESAGSIFEFKGSFPVGRNGHGYYNLGGESGLHGHLKLEGEVISRQNEVFLLIIVIAENGTKIIKSVCVIARHLNSHVFVLRPK